MDNIELRKAVQEYCKNNGVTKKYISEKLGLNSNTLYHWLRAEFNLSDDKLKELAAIIERG